MIKSFEIFGTPSRRIMDPVHGSIPVFSHEMKVIDHPLFQRLRNIIQNDVVFLVFPGARHNRLLHSIGTMHMVSSLYKQLITSHLVRTNSGIIEESKKESITYIHCCLRLAALLHDAGHCPFSHQFENSESIHQFFNSSILKKWISDENIKKYFEEKIESFSHEHLSIVVSLKILESTSIDYQSSLLIEDILFFLEKSTNPPSEKLLHHCENLMDIFTPGLKKSLEETSINNIFTSFLKFLKHLISGELDADKMDYLMRDSYFSGCRYGMYNKDHLINSLRVGYLLHSTSIDSNKKKIFDIDFNLAVLEKGVGAFEDFVYCRYQMYLELYNHRTVSGFRKLLSLALEEVLSNKESQKEVSRMLESEIEFSNFTDSFFWEKFNNIALKNSNSASKKLIDREVLKYFGKVENENESEIKKICKRESTKTKKNISYWKSKVKFSNIDDSYHNIKVLYTDSNGQKQLKKISESTDFFKKFDLKNIYHLFEIPIISSIKNI